MQWNSLLFQITPRQCLVNSTYSRFREDFDSDYLGTALEGKGFISRLMFCWVEPLMNKGMCSKLQCTDDLFDLPESMTSAHLYEELSSALVVSDKPRFRFRTLCRAGFMHDNGNQENSWNDPLKLWELKLAGNFISSFTENNQEFDEYRS